MKPCEPFQYLVSKRIQKARKCAGMSQGELAKRMRFKNRQTVSDIERCLRKIDTDELMKLIEIFDKCLEYFTDPYFFDAESEIRFSFNHHKEK